MSVTERTEPTNCENLFCDNEAEWVFTPDLGDETPVCNNCSYKFPREKLRYIDTGVTNDCGRD